MPVAASQPKKAEPNLNPPNSAFSRATTSCRSGVTSVGLSASAAEPRAATGAATGAAVVGVVSGAAVCADVVGAAAGGSVVDLSGVAAEAGASLSPGRSVRSAGVVLSSWRGSTRRSATVGSGERSFGPGFSRGVSG
ncbi:hypothetical protein L3i23_23040 [Herbiconiux sp. L3-i23]|nr:hypothetical protein L3i23_23040 [Herbiconiux sp. L3-i23]